MVSDCLHFHEAQIELSLRTQTFECDIICYNPFFCSNQKNGFGGAEGGHNCGMKFYTKRGLLTHQRFSKQEGLLDTLARDPQR